MRMDRKLIGAALGAALALAGPGGLAVGYFSHPTGQASHPVQLQLNADAGDGAYGWNYRNASGVRAWADVWAYRSLSDASASASLTDGQYHRGTGEMYIYASMTVCTDRCRSNYGFATSAKNSTLRFEMGPGMQQAILSGTLGGQRFRAVLDATELPSVGRYDYQQARPYPPLVYSEFWVGLNARMRLDNMTFGELSSTFPSNGWGYASRSSGAGACAGALTSSC